jgi:ABC-type antimicrobial peptide transport system permease subunit
LLALVLACLGLYGLLSYEVTRRTREIGIRMAVGAQSHDVVGLVLTKAVGLIVAGAIAGTLIDLANYCLLLIILMRDEGSKASRDGRSSGLHFNGFLILGASIAVALGVTRFLASFLYGVKAGDPITLLCVAALLTAVALIACYVPARRATKVDPLMALRYE